MEKPRIGQRPDDVGHKKNRLGAGHTETTKRPASNESLSRDCSPAGNGSKMLAHQQSATRFVPLPHFPQVGRAWPSI